MTSRPVSLPPHVRALLRPSAYEPRPKSIELVQTHISYVLLVGDDVYKLKKAVDFGFVDFTTLEKRRLACEAEVRLNRRGCPGNVYLGVEKVTRQGQRYCFGGAGEVVDFAVHMRRLPRERMMDALLAAGAVNLEMIGALAGRIAELHREAERGPEITRLGGVSALRENWRANLDQVRAFVGITTSARRFRRIEAYASRFMAAESALLQAREREGFVRDCHGDLRSDAVCFDAATPGGICLFDCIEFNRRFRCTDTALDVAFLAMDLDFRGHADLSDLLIGLYIGASGDRELPLLVDFYKAHRAVVRGEVEGLLLQDEGVSRRDRAAARQRARAYFELAEAYARRPRWDGFVLVMGASGSGKSVLAGALAARFGAVLLSTDLLRRDLFASSGRGEIDTGIYTPASRERVYDELTRQAEAYVRAGRPVVIDGTFIEKRQRAPIVGLAESTGRQLLVVECEAPDAVVRERQTKRRSETWGASEGTFEVYQVQRAQYEAPDEVGAERRVTVDTTRPLVEQIERVTAKLGAAAQASSAV